MKELKKETTKAPMGEPVKERKERVYISGQISGQNRDVYLARFAKAEELLRNIGYPVVNPTKFLLCRWRWLYRLVGYTLTLLYDLWRLSKCDRIYLIPGWNDSRGACVESFFAFHMKIRRLPSFIKDDMDNRMAKWIDKQERVRDDSGSK